LLGVDGLKIIVRALVVDVTRTFSFISDIIYKGLTHVISKDQQGASIRNWLFGLSSS